MSTTDRIESLLKRGVVHLDIGPVPKSDHIYVKAGQVTPTGPGNDHIQVTHQAEGSLADCLETISKHVDHVNALKPTIVQLPKGGRG